MILAADASFPVGVAKKVGNVLTFNQPFDFDAAGRWSFDGLEVWFEADATLTRPYLYNGITAHLIQIGNAGKSPNVVINSGQLDPVDLVSGGEGAIQLVSGTLATSNTDWGDAARDFMSMMRGKWISRGDKFGLAGVRCGVGSHIDGAAHIYGGDVVFDGCIIDARLHTRPAPTGGWTALVYGQAINAPVNVKIRNTPILGAVDLKLLYPIQTNPRNFDVSFDVRGCPIEPGTNGKVFGDTPVGGRKSRYTGAYNTNATTGQPLVVSS